MNNEAYINAVEAVKADLIEAATEMGLDVEWYKQEVISEERCMSLLGVEIAEKMLQTA